MHCVTRNSRHISWKKPGIVRSILLLLLLSTAGFTHTACQERIINAGVQSSILDREVGYKVILPAGYPDTNEDYPLVFLLHGFGGDSGSWLHRCNIQSLIDSLEQEKLIRPYVYVLPDAGNSYYINNYDSTERYMDFFTEELLPEILEKYRVKDESRYRALLGLSMGGFGAVILAMEHPDLFGNVMALSAAVRTAAIFKALSERSYNKHFISVYGPAGSPQERITDHWKANSPYELVDSTLASRLTEINWYIDCGMNDPLLPANEAFHDLFLKFEIPHDFHVRPGTHNWEYWYHSTIYALQFFEENCR